MENLIQLSVFIENRKGRLRGVTKVLKDTGIDIRALSIAETQDFGVLRLIVNNPDLAYEKLRENGFIVKKTKVLAVEVDDRPGGFDNVLEVLEKNNINIEYMYAFVEKHSDKALLVMRFDDMEKALKILLDNKINVIEAQKIYNI
ncbi:MAG TPA: amino acid-binding protein [Spirochaetota bacterium]|nr:amino acid-binding protein [Spirochaetota bacterium]HOM37603.1 amino acid-binding protein [Spirochaetota bacterium]HPQ49426.1 amino acid-binding protein [Spirochaetota bacterium]